MVQIEASDAPQDQHESVVSPAPSADYKPDYSTAEVVGRAGEPLGPKMAVGTIDTAISLLQLVYDPEIPVNIFDLGLVYQIKVDQGGDVFIAMTLTAPGCPVAGSLPQQVAEVVASDIGFGEVRVVLVWEPPWTPDHMSEDAKMALDLF